MLNVFEDGGVDLRHSSVNVQREENAAVRDKSETIESMDNLI